MVWSGSSSTYEDGDERHIPHRKRLDDHPMEAIETVAFRLRRMAVEDYGDRLPCHGALPIHRLETAEQRSDWEAMSLLLALADYVESDHRRA